MLFDGCKYIPFILKVFHFAQIFFKHIRILPQNTSFKQVNIAKERLFLATNRSLCRFGVRNAIPNCRYFDRKRLLTS